MMTCGGWGAETGRGFIKGTHFWLLGSYQPGILGYANNVVKIQRRASAEYEQKEKIKTVL